MEFKGTKELITQSQIIEACDKAYKECVHNSYFSNGFHIGVRFAFKKSKAPEMLEMLKKIVLITDNYKVDFNDFRKRYNEEIKQLIKEATEL